MRRYYGTTESINNNVYRCEIWDTPKLYIGDYKSRCEADGGVVEGLDCVYAILAGSELNMAGSGFVITYNQQGDKLWEDNIRSSKIQAQFVVSETEDHNFFQNLAVEYEGEFALVVYKNDTLFYVGRILADQMQYERRPEKNTVYTITAVDSLGLLSKYKVNPDWFEADGRITLLNLILKSLQETYLPSYYTLLGFDDSYIIDGSIHNDVASGNKLFFGKFAELQINLTSTIRNLTLFNDRNTLDDESIYISCQQAIENVLRAFACRLIYSQGKFYIYDPILFATRTFVYVTEHDINGDYVSKPTINPQYAISDEVKPRFEAFPIYTHQPAQRKIVQTMTRRSFAYAIRKRSAPSTNVFQTNLISIGAGGVFTGKLLASGSISWNAVSFTGVAPPKQQYAEINFRIFIDLGSGSYKHYDYTNQAWTGPQSSIPFYEKIRCEVTNYQTFGSQYAEFTADFIKTFNMPLAGENVIVQVLMGNIQWNWTTGTISNAISIWGSLNMSETEAAPRKITSRNDKNLNASEEDDFVAIYGDGLVDGVGSVVYKTDDTSALGNFAYWSSRQIAAYINAPKTVECNIIDDGDYAAIFVPNFDDESYTFNGGQFSAQLEQWDIELLKIAEDVVNVDQSELDNQDEIDINDDQNNALRRAFNQIELIRESVGNTPTSMPYDILANAVNTPTSEPTVNTNFLPYINYDTTTEFLTWNVQELGKVQSLVGGTHDLDATCELIICDASAEAVIINLPDPSEVKGLKYHFKKISSSNQVQLNGTIDGVGVYSFNGKDDCKVLMSDGTAYYLVAYYHK